MTEHTPGPWTAKPRSVLNDGTQDQTSDGLGWDIEGPPEPQLRGQFKLAADARLIAASPTMYDYVAKQAGSGDNEATKLLEAIHGSSEG